MVMAQPDSTHGIPFGYLKSPGVIPEYTGKRKPSPGASLGGGLVKQLENHDTKQMGQTESVFLDEE